MLILNGNTPDDAVADVAEGCSKRSPRSSGKPTTPPAARRHHPLSCRRTPTPWARSSMASCDFAVRSGLKLQDVPRCSRRGFASRAGGGRSAHQEEGPTADEIMSEFHMPDSEVREFLRWRRQEALASKRIMVMNASEKIKLATKGNKEARGILIRDSNKLVSVRHPQSAHHRRRDPHAGAEQGRRGRRTEGDSYSKREGSQIRHQVALVKNPKVPQGVSMRLVSTLHEQDEEPGQGQECSWKCSDARQEADGEEDRAEARRRKVAAYLVQRPRRRWSENRSRGAPVARQPTGGVLVAHRRKANAANGDASAARRSPSCGELYLALGDFVDFQLVALGCRLAECIEGRLQEAA